MPTENWLFVNVQVDVQSDKLRKVHIITGVIAVKVLVGALITDKFKEDLVNEFSDIDFLFGQSEQEEINLVEDADIYMGNITREIFLASKKIRWIQCPGTVSYTHLTLPTILLV